jgi:hypothetical protein
MINNDIKQLEKLMRLCRKMGVTYAKVLDVELQFGSEPRKASKPVEIPQDPLATVSVPKPNLYSTLEPDPPIQTDELTDEQKLFWSSADAHEQQ